MFKIPTVLSSEELIDKIFRKASKIHIEDKNKFYRVKKTNIAKISSIWHTIYNILTAYISSFPNIEALPKFYSELIEILVDVKKFKRALASLNWAREKVKEISDKTISQIRRTGKITVANEKLRYAYGRISSVIKEINKDLIFLNSARQKLDKIPTINANLKTIVIAGYPNVGKSLLVRKISTAKPEIASYPFTTKKILVGIFEHKGERYQVIDIPGLLDREFNERNEIEKQAILALKHLANLIVFVLDYSEHCGYRIEPQLNLLKMIKENFAVKIIEVENKCDIFKNNSNRLKISAEIGEGIEELKKEILKTIS